MYKPHLKTNKTYNLVQHIVCFKFLTNTSSDEVKLLEQSFFALRDKIPGVLKIDGGKNNSPENLNKGLTHCFIITFKDEDARANYLPHPQHKEFVTQLKPILEDVFVIDFSSQN
ncbi:MAG: Dabb family protein [Opitutales bacterium]|nr:Dabb family protein [Opitutales bacterium]